MIKETLALLLFVWCFSLDAARLEWDPNPEENVAGYKVFWGPSSRNYIQNETVTGRLSTQFQLPTDRFYGTETYYFAVTAFTADGLESDFSEEIFWTVPMRMKAEPNLITVNVKPGDNYVLERTSDFVSWFGVDARTADSSNFVFTVPSSLDSNFYRLKKLEPEPLFAMASAMKSMEKGLLVSVTEENTLKTKEKLTRKVKRFFRYRRRFEPNERKGAEMLLKKSVSNVEPGSLPMPPMPRLK